MEPLSDSHRCIQCSYELRGLPSNTRCPECGAEFWRSLHGDARMLRDEDRLLRRANLHRRNRDAAGILSMFAIVGLIASTVLPRIVEGPIAAIDLNPIWIGSALWNAVLFATLSFYFKSRFRHAQSVAQYRRIVDLLSHRVRPSTQAEE